MSGGVTNSGTRETASQATPSRTSSLGKFDGMPLDIQATACHSSFGRLVAYVLNLNHETTDSSKHDFGPCRAAQGQQERTNSGRHFIGRHHA
jgi:hypothetical protein